MIRNSKKHNIWRIISLLLALCITTAFLPIVALADNTASISVTFRQGSEDKGWVEIKNGTDWDVYNGPGYQNAEAVRIRPITDYSVDWTGIALRVNGTDILTDDIRNQLTGEDGYTLTAGTEYTLENVEFRQGNGGSPGPEPGGDENGLTIELGGNPSVSNGTFTYEHGIARVMFERGNGEGAYDGSENRITLNDDVTAVKIILIADDGYQGELATGGNNPPVPEPEVSNEESTYTFERSAIEAAGNFVAFNIEFTGEDNPGGDAPITWHTVSWSGGNVTVEHGTVAAERVHLGNKIFTVNREESSESDSDNIYPIEDIIGEEGQEGLGVYGLGYGDTDLFIDNSVNEAVSIDFKFIPDYGYQLSDILTNGTDSLLGNFTASVSEISTFNFAVRPDGGNVHFIVVFAEAEYTIDVTSTSVTGASIMNGENAADSGNLKMTVADVQEDEVSDELKARAGESALYLDMNLYQVVSKGGDNGDWEKQLTDLDDTITVTLNVPAPAEGSSYYIVREHGDGDNKTYDRIEVTFVPDESDPTMGTVTFETDKFSTYAIATTVSVRVNTIDNSVDASSIRVSLNIRFRDKETGEEEPLEGIYKITPENVTVGTFETVKTNAIEEAKTKLNEYLELTRRGNPDVQFTAVGDMAVEGDKVSFDNRTYTMRNGELGGGTTSRYMEITGDYGYTGSYSVTMTVEVQADGDIPSYSVIEGANGTWTQNSDGTLAFRANGDFDKFTGVKVDDTLIDPKNYTAVSGSTVITLSADYLKTLSVGTHKLTVVYTDGECGANFEIKTTQTENGGGSDSEKSPQTGDNSNHTLWFAILFVSGVGVLGTTVYKKRKNIFID